VAIVGLCWHDISHYLAWFGRARWYKRPGGLALIPWQGGKSPAFSTLAQSYVDRTALGVGMVAELEAERKSVKYSEKKTIFSVS